MALTNDQKAKLFDMGFTAKQMSDLMGIIAPASPAPAAPTPAPAAPPVSPTAPAQGTAPASPTWEDVMKMFAGTQAQAAPEPAPKAEPLTRNDMETLLQKFTLNTSGAVIDVPKSNEELLAGALDEYWGYGSGKEGEQ